MTLSQAVHATLVDSQGVATIVNDDEGEVMELPHRVLDVTEFNQKKCS